MVPRVLDKSRRHEAVHKTRALIAQTWESQLNLSIFLGILVLTVFVMPTFGLGQRYGRLTTDLTYSFILISGVAIAWGVRYLFALSVCFGAVALSLRWAAWRFGSDGFGMGREITTLLSIALVCWILLVQVFRRGNITTVRVQGALAVYLLLGVAWAHGYQILNHLRPDSFQSTAGTFTSVGEWHYFSFVTLATLGYGDIVPVKPVARSLAIGEALTGQLYLAVLIARLVAMEVMSWQPEATQKSDE